MPNNIETLIKAHQYLYYVKGTPVLTDREYDRICSDNGLFGGGGSDMESSYTEEEKTLAASLLQGR